MATKRRADQMAFIEPLAVGTPYRMAKRVKVNAASVFNPCVNIMDLPAEIRNRIYGFVLAGSKASNWSVQVKPSNNFHEVGFRSMLCLGKQMSQEFKSLLVKEATYHIAIKCINNRFKFSMKGETYSDLSKTPLRKVVASGAKRFEVHIAFDRHDDIFMYPSYADTSITFETLMGQYIYNIMRIAAALNHARAPLKYLGVHIWARSKHHYVSENVSLILAPFFDLRGVKQFELKFRRLKHAIKAHHDCVNCGLMGYHTPCFCAEVPLNGNMSAACVAWQSDMQKPRDEINVRTFKLINDFRHFQPLIYRADQLFFLGDLNAESDTGLTPIEWKAVVDKLFRSVVAGDPAKFDVLTRRILDAMKEGRAKKQGEIQEFDDFAKAWIAKCDALHGAKALVAEIVTKFFPAEIDIHDLQ